nr:DUF6766 family protein [Rhizobium populisoli]
MLLTGWGVHNEELTQHGAQQLDLWSDALSGHFLSALFEKWESEFLQMSAYVMLTAIFFQRGSAESKDPDEPASQDQDPREKQHDARSALACSSRSGSALPLFLFPRDSTGDPLHPELSAPSALQR